jgi:predicted nucleic acid-binding protein
VTLVGDTTVLIDLLRGLDAAIAWARSLGEPLTCSEISRVEILRGVRTEERRTTERLLETLTWVPLDEAIARRAGELGRSWRRSHQGIATADLIVAATADMLDATLATLNVKHFPMFEGLQRPYGD